jgi:hypothetical protein
MGDADDEQLIDRLEDALEGARRQPAFPEAVALPDAVAELRRWLADERQWHHAPGSSWHSLAGDVLRAVMAYPDAVLVHAGNPCDLRDELDLCVKETADRNLRREALLRRRLGELADRLADGLAVAPARCAAWEDLLARSASPEPALHAALRLLALADLAGQDADGVRKGLLFDLAGGHLRPLAPVAHRLRRAGERVAADPRFTTVAVWLRLLFAPVGEPPVIELGPAVRLYQGQWLRSVLAANGHPEVPADAAIDDWVLHSLCGVRVDSNGDKRVDDEDPDMPTALVRVELDHVRSTDAEALARRTAATLGALGTLYGAAPSLWQLDTSFVTFRDGRRSASQGSPPPAESATFAERVGIGRDPTAAVLRHEAERLGRHLPVREGRMLEIAELLVWLRDATSSPPPARLVLCDRAIETVSGWAGVATPRRFVDEYLIPSWAHLRMLDAIGAIAIDVLHNDNRAHYFEHLPEHQAWAEIVDDPDLGLREAANSRRPIALARMLARLDWLSDRIPEGHPAHRRIDVLQRDVRTAKTTLAWFNRLVAEGRINESRRSRTRNALMHGGPLAGATVNTVLPFAQHMAEQSLGRALDAHLDGESTGAAFLRRSRAVQRMRRRLSAGVPAHEALSWN